METGCEKNQFVVVRPPALAASGIKLWLDCSTAHRSREKAGGHRWLGDLV